MAKSILLIHQKSSTSLVIEEMTTNTKMRYSKLTTFTKIKGADSTHLFIVHLRFYNIGAKHILTFDNPVRKAEQLILFDL